MREASFTATTVPYVARCQIQGYTSGRNGLRVMAAQLVVV